MILLKKHQLAAALGRSPGYVSAMVRAGFVMRYGMTTTKASALNWLAENPSFRASHHYPRKTQQPLRQPTSPAASTAGMSGELTR